MMEEGPQTQLLIWATRVTDGEGDKEVIRGSALKARVSYVQEMRVLEGRDLAEECPRREGLSRGRSWKRGSCKGGS